MLTLNFDPFPFIETERLVLKGLTQDDVNSVFALRSNKQLMDKLDKEPMNSESEASDFIERIERALRENSSITWGIFLKKENLHIGNIGFHNIYPEHHRAEIGYALLPAFQGKEIMQEAIEPVLKYGFNGMQLHSIEAKINPLNDASKGILEKNGFIKEAHLKESYLFRNVFLDTAIYSLFNPINS